MKSKRSDKHVEAVVKKLRARSRAGLKKYGVTLERKDLSLKQWIEHLQQELMDGANYSEKCLKLISELLLMAKLFRDSIEDGIWPSRRGVCHQRLNRITAEAEGK